MRRTATVLTLAILAAMIPCVGGSQVATRDSAAAARRARAGAAMARQRARSDSAAALVETLVATPTRLQLHVGDRVGFHAFWSRLRVVGLTSRGDTVRRFSKTFALLPNPYLEQDGPELVARRAGSATLWVYAGTDMTRRFFADTSRSARVEIQIR